MSVSTHRAIAVTRHGGPEVLQAIQKETTPPGTGEVLVRTLAAGVSGYDLMLRKARFPGFPKPPFIPGVDIVGVVEEVGEDVDAIGVGDTIAALLPFEGGYAEAAVLPADRAVLVPEGVQPPEAVCVVANYLTAYAMLHRAAKVQSGDRILVHGAAGGVGTALVELGRLAGLEIYGTASSHNHELVASLGATPIDYRNEDFVTRIRTLTADGVDAVFDPIGGAKQLWRSYRTLRPGGRLVWFGVAATAKVGVKVIPASLVTRLLLSLLPDGKKAPMPPDASKTTDWYRETLTLLLDLLAAGKIEPVITARFPLTEAARAHEMLETGGHAGKVVLVTDNDPL